MNKQKFYITTAIDYTNAVIHIGHAYQKILSDALARYHRQIGDKTFFLTGTDEHGQKVEKAAIAKGISPKRFVDRIAKEDKKEWDSLNISYDRFFRTTDKDHIKFAQEFYLKSKKNGDIYLSQFEGLYCEGCEEFKEENELINGKCPLHPTKEIQKVSEENYFFALSKYQNFLLDHIKKHPEFIFPDSKRKEVIAFIKGGLKDFSISRQNVKWGIPVPDDSKHTIYVWFDALINYLTYGVENKCWPANIHVLGKDNLKFHAIYWPAMLKSAGYSLPKTILCHDFISLNGKKISKSLGNVILPSELVKKFGVDGTRYYFLRHGPLTSDVDISFKKIAEVYNSDLANGLGNLVSRVAKIAENSDLKFSIKKYNFDIEIELEIKKFNVNESLKNIWDKIRELDQLINYKKIWELKGKELEKCLNFLINDIRQIAFDLKPFLPETAEKIQNQFKESKIKSGKPLFPRLK